MGKCCHFNNLLGFYLSYVQLTVLFFVITSYPTSVSFNGKMNNETFLTIVQSFYRRNATVLVDSVDDNDDFVVLYQHNYDNGKTRTMGR